MLGGEKREKNRRKQVLEIKREQSNGAIIIIHEQSRIITPGATGSRFFLSKREGRSCSINNRISPEVIRFQLRSRRSVNEPDISSDRIHSARNRISSGPRIKEEEKETKRPDTTPHKSSNGRSRTIGWHRWTFCKADKRRGRVCKCRGSGHRAKPSYPIPLVGDPFFSRGHRRCKRSAGPRGLAGRPPRFAATFPIRNQRCTGCPPT